ncbi:MAG TPA: hypothetical protein VHC86_08845 [Opitutaceae bacterium]|nr:hypothetical protein [Opitutaceae bacterium]
MFKPDLAGPARAFFGESRGAADALPRRRRRREAWVAAAAMALVLAFQGWTAFGTGSHPLFDGRQTDYYNLLAHSLRHGHLYLPIQPDPRLVAAADPYNPARRPPGVIVHDASYFRGRYYIYFGVSPVVTLVLPWQLLTGHDLPGVYQTFFFTGLGFLAASLTWLALRRRYFPASGWGTMVAGIAVFGLAVMTHAVLRRSSMWEQAIAGGYGFAMLGVACLYGALHGERRGRWMAGAGAALALAIGARPTYAAGGAALAVPVLWAWLKDGGWAGREWRRMVAGAALGGAPIVASLLWYNWARFGDPLQFGGHYQVNAAYEFAAPHFRLSYVPYNLRAYFVAGGRWARYFPFLELGRGVPAPPGFYGVEYVYGIFAVLPVAWLAWLAPLAWRGRATGEPLRAFAGCLLLLFLGVAGLLACWWVAAARYMVDFTPELMLLAAIGLLGLERSARGRWRPAALGAAGIAALGSVFAGAMMSFQLHTLLRQTAPATFARLARAFDTPVAWAEALAGTRYGPREITLRFPAGRTGRTEPLVTTGWEFYSDHLFVDYLDGHHVRFGFDHLSHGRIWSRSIETDYAATHTLRVAMGSLWPPRVHPYFRRMTPEEIQARAGWLRVELDGKVVFDTPADCYDASPEGTWFGADPDGFYGRRFSGDLLSVRWARPYAGVATAPAYGPVEMDVALPPEALGRSLPLVSSGVPGRGDLLSVREVRPGWVRFGYDDWGSEYCESGEVSMAEGETHALRLRLPSLLAPGGSPAERALRLSLLVEMDDRVVWTHHAASAPAGPGQAYFGRNQIGATSAQARFNGGIARIERTALPTEAGEASGPVRFRLELPDDAFGRSEPLLTTGVPGRADIVSVQYLDLGHVRFQLDHWGVAFMRSPPVAVNYALLHDLEIRQPSLEAAAAGGETAGEIEVRLDGATVWRQRSAFYPAPPGSVAAAINATGSSTCAPAFTGGIVDIRRGSDSGR